MLPWRTAMQAALYGPAGFYTGPHARGPAAHFRTSPHVAEAFAAALWRLICFLDVELGSPSHLDVVDMAAGNGELLTQLSHCAATHPGNLAQRAKLTGVELRERPPDLPADIDWTHQLGEIGGLLIANEWLDNVPLDIAELDDAAVARLVAVNTATGEQQLAEPLTSIDNAWLARWWPLRNTGDRAELGHTRDAAWRHVVGAVRRGVALAIDYGHVRDARPPLGTLTGYADGHQVRPLPDGRCDITAHVAVDAVATACRQAHAETIVIRQSDALRTLGIRGGRPSIELAHTDPAEYLRSLVEASYRAELTDRSGLGNFWWIAQPVGLSAASQQRLAQCLGTAAGHARI